MPIQTNKFGVSLIIASETCQSWNGHARARNPDSTGRTQKQAGNWLTNGTRQAEYPNGRQLILVAALGSAKVFVNGELNVTNLILPVNRSTPF
jgi:hypothetical protein